MSFIDYSTYLFESDLQGLSFYYFFDKKQKIVHIVLMSQDKCVGYITAEHYINDDWEISKVVADKGYGHHMYEAVMELLQPSWLIPNRKKMVNLKLANTYNKFQERDDIETQKITQKDDSFVEAPKEQDNWFNRKYRLTTPASIDFIKTNYKFIEKTGLKLFDEKYRGNYKPSF